MRFIQPLVLPVLVIAAAAGFYLASTTTPPEFDINATKFSASARYKFGATVERVFALLGNSPYHADRWGPHEHSRRSSDRESYCLLPARSVLSNWNAPSR
jgi:hypothetical protein